ncbi:MAG: hypothetical protein GQ546_08410 [Gammaproteobacteria bacterium]|nr:hypothetical protein [Gammaproteobacteria bacterium]
MRINKLLLAGTITMMAISLNANAWWAGSWEERSYDSSYDSDTPASEDNNNTFSQTNYNQQQFDAYRKYQNEIKAIHREYQNQAREADKAYQEQMRQWYKN